ncbi:hypothetical protein TURU_109577 [Turdus rufiventris]|nr:hypothetical protein TURU_109577 [Turdus rufiventris]
MAAKKRRKIAEKSRGKAAKYRPGKRLKSGEKWPRKVVKKRQKIAPKSGRKAAEKRQKMAPKKCRKSWRKVVKNHPKKRPKMVVKCLQIENLPVIRYFVVRHVFSLLKKKKKVCLIVRPVRLMVVKLLYVSFGSLRNTISLRKIRIKTEIMKCVSGWNPIFGCVNHTTQLGVICKLAKASLDPDVGDIDEGRLTIKFATTSKFGNAWNLVLVAGRPKSSFSEVTSGELMTELEDPRYSSSSKERKCKINTCQLGSLMFKASINGDIQRVMVNGSVS